MSKDPEELNLEEANRRLSAKQKEVDDLKKKVADKRVQLGQHLNRDEPKERPLSLDELHELNIAVSSAPLLEKALNETVKVSTRKHNVQMDADALNASNNVFTSPVAYIERVKGALADAPEHERERVLNHIRAQCIAEGGRFKPDLDKLEREVLSLAEKHELVKGIRDFLNTIADRKLRLERAVGSRAHSLEDAFVSGKLVTWTPKDLGTIHRGKAEDGQRIGEVFVVEHDWGSAFKGAGEFDGGTEWHLPYDRCCFEFQIAGLRVCALTHTDDKPMVAVAIETPIGWITGDDDFFSAFKQIASYQIKAICVALEAEVTVTEVVRAPHKLNRARERRGKLPILSHHVVRLSRRTRAASLPAGVGHNSAYSTAAEHEEYTRKRLHFRRGHWRHFSEHKTWIKWMLVGDPDLGWIDKDYRL